MKKEHHIWCNLFYAPAENCKMCEGLNKYYRMGKLTPDELLKTHFPSVVVGGATNIKADKD